MAWCKGCKSLDSEHSSELSTGSVWEEQTGPCAPQIFDTILSCLVLWEWKSIDVSRELPMKNRCSLNMQNAKDKHQSGVVLSTPGGGFESRKSAT
jgi:hypothetical protein